MRLFEANLVRSAEGGNAAMNQKQCRLIRPLTVSSRLPVIDETRADSIALNRF